jgi:hypothetical protein
VPSFIPNYIYTIFAMIIVGALIIGMAGLATSNLRQEAEKQQLSNIAGYVATKSLELASNAPTANSTSTVFLDIPTLIGAQRYWIRIANDSTKAWVETGFGTSVFPSEHRTEIPLDMSASGTFVSGSGRAFLRCYSSFNGSQPEGISLEIYGDR